jgi:hypothetical protein
VSDTNVPLLVLLDYGDVHAGAATDFWEQEQYEALKGTAGLVPTFETSG